MEIIKTTERFNMSVDELLEIRNEAGYTREECLILDEALVVEWFDSLEEYENNKEYLQTHMKKMFSKLEMTEILETINGRIAVLYN